MSILLAYQYETGERKYLGLELVELATEIIKKIQRHVKMSQSRQKCYADKRRKPIEFTVGEQVILKVSPMRGVMWFGKKGKLSPRYVGPFEILERIGPVAYRLALPNPTTCVHDVFHVSMLHKYIRDPSHVLRHKEIGVTPEMKYEVQPEKILDRQEK